MIQRLPDLALSDHNYKLRLFPLEWGGSKPDRVAALQAPVTNDR